MTRLFPLPMFPVHRFVDVADLDDVIDCNRPPVVDQLSAFIVLGPGGWHDGTAFADHDQTGVGYVQTAAIAHVHAKRLEGSVFQTVQ